MAAQSMINNTKRAQFFLQSSPPVPPPPAGVVARFPQPDDDLTIRILNIVANFDIRGMILVRSLNRRYRAFYQDRLCEYARLYHIQGNKKSIIKLFHYLCAFGYEKEVKTLLGMPAADLGGANLVDAATPCRIYHPLVPYEPVQIQRKPVDTAVWYGQASILRFLVARNAHFSARGADKFGATPLHIACGRGHLATVKWFTSSQQRGEGALSGALAADLNAVAEDASTPLHWACRGGHDHIVAHLLTNTNAKTNYVDESENTPLHYAAAEGCAGAVGLLLSAESPTNSKNSDLQTPLHVACHGGHAAVVELLLQRKYVRKGINKPDVFGCTALHYACQSGSVDCVRMLLDCGATIEAAPCSKGDARYSVPKGTPMDVAREHERWDIVELLEYTLQQQPLLLNPSVSLPPPPASFSASASSSSAAAASSVPIAVTPAPTVMEATPMAISAPSSSLIPKATPALPLPSVAPLPAIVASNGDDSVIAAAAAAASAASSAAVAAADQGARKRRRTEPQ